MSAATQVTTKVLVRQQAHAKTLSLSSRKKASSAISGLHDSRFRGRGMDYQESRVYQAGDDIRNMDWLVTARTGTAHTKLFQEERERPIHIIMDTNSSMAFGTRKEFKSVTAAKAASLLAWAAVKNGDRVGVMSYGKNGIHHEKPVGGKRGMMRLIAHLVQSDAKDSQQQTLLQDALRRLRTIIRPGSLIIIISDFYHLGTEVKRHLVQLNKHNDVLALFIADIFEINTPLPGIYGVNNGEKSVVFNANKHSDVQNMQAKQNLHLDSIYANIQKSGVAVIPILTSDKLQDKVKQAMKSPAAAWSSWKNGLKTKHG
ncbi:hypothetical protein PA3071 [hydrothermal vent metagenome]|uniref:DUF58 domain-containing protein n=1 Tax=hydrothermal vent metagenome TaxID=652676 RepID=A0A3B0VJA7_9ZZZZ